MMSASLGSRFKEVPSPKNTEYISPPCLLLLSPSSQLSAKDKSGKLLMTCIHCAVQKKKISPFGIFGIRFEGSCWQLNAFIIRFFWSKPAGLRDSLHIFVSYGKANYSSAASWCVCVFACCVCLRAPNILAGVCLSKGDLCHCWAFTSWQLEAWWFKNNPALSNFVIYRGRFLRVFWFCVRPPGMLGVTSGRFLSHGPSSWCPQLFLNSLQRTQK